MIIITASIVVGSIFLIGWLLSSLYSGFGETWKNIAVASIFSFLVVFIIIWIYFGESRFVVKLCEKYGEPLTHQSINVEGIYKSGYPAYNRTFDDLLEENYAYVEGSYSVLSSKKQNKELYVNYSIGKKGDYSCIENDDLSWTKSLVKSFDRKISDEVAFEETCLIAEVSSSRKSRYGYYDLKKKHVDYTLFPEINKKQKESIKNLRINVHAKYIYDFEEEKVIAKQLSFGHSKYFSSASCHTRLPYQEILIPSKH